MTVDRSTVAARRTLGANLTEAFQPVEQHADLTAAQGFRFLALALEGRRIAALPVSAGDQAIELIYEGCQHSYEAQARFRRAHAMWPSLSEEFGDLFAPECPPKAESGAMPTLRSVA